MHSDEDSKAVRAVAEAAGKVVDAAREFGGFIGKYVGGPLEQGIGIFEDKLWYMRWERQQRLMAKAKQFLAANEMSGPTRRISMKVAIPLLQGASLEEDDELQDRWAKLLVNAADEDSGIDVSRIYITILERITRFEAQVLDKIYSVPKEKANKGIWTRDLPDAVILDPNKDEDMSLAPQLEVALANLAQLYLITGALFWGGGQGLTCVHQTRLGQAFIDACKLRSEK